MSLERWIDWRGDLYPHDKGYYFILGSNWHFGKRVVFHPGFGDVITVKDVNNISSGNWRQSGRSVMFVGQRIRVKRKPDEEWQNARVISVNPLEFRTEQWSNEYKSEDFSSFVIEERVGYKYEDEYFRSEYFIESLQSQKDKSGERDGSWESDGSSIGVENDDKNLDLLMEVEAEAEKRMIELMETHEEEKRAAARKSREIHEKLSQENAILKEKLEKVKIFHANVNTMSMEELQELVEQCLQKAESASKEQKRRRDTTCTICCDGDKNAALIPCGHRLCGACACRLDICPFCNKRKDSVLKLFN